MKYYEDGQWKDVQIKVANAIQNEYGESNNDGYSQNYLNDKVVNVGTEVDRRSRVNVIYSRLDINNVSLWEQGSYVRNTGDKSTSTSRIRTKDKVSILGGKQYQYKLGSGYGLIDFYMWSDTSTYKGSYYNLVSQSINNSNSGILDIPDDVKYITISICKTNGADITTSDFNSANPIIELVPSIYVDNEEIYSKPVVLWQNSSPTSEFTSGSITLNDNLSNYSYYEVLAKTFATENNIITSGRIPTTFSGEISRLVKQLSRYRAFTNNNSSLTFSDAEGINTNATGSTSVNNSWLVPYQVIGYGKKATSSSQTRSLQTISIPENDGEGEIVRGEET